MRHDRKQTTLVHSMKRGAKALILSVDFIHGGECVVWIMKMGIRGLL